MSKFNSQIYRLVAIVPHGRVVTYGQLATLAGFPGHARQVGRALANCPDSIDIPWHRVVNAKGEVSTRSQWSHNAGSEIAQRVLLEEEGVEFGLHGKLSLKRYQIDL